MAGTVRIKNTCKDRVGIVGFGDIKPGITVIMDERVWKALHKPWPKSKVGKKKYRCERLKECLVCLSKPKSKTKKKKTSEQVKSETPKVPEKGPQALSTKNFRARTKHSPTQI